MILEGSAMKFIIPFLASFLITVVVTPLVIRAAKACKCLDVPNGRRLHKDVTPRWGGVAFFAGVLPLLVIVNENGALTSYIVASFLLVGMGIVDDLRSLDWRTKFAVMTGAATIVIFGGDIIVHTIGTYGPLGQVELGWLSIPFTYLSIIGITNAINLLDGLNGLAGGVSLLAFLFMGIAAVLAGNIMLALVCFAFVGALAAFLLYNFPTAKVFMGDSGSIFLGFSLALMAVFLTQDAGSSVNAMFPVLVLLVPIYDTLRVLVVRFLNGKNPFKADNLHLHYLMVHKNISPVHVVLLFWSVSIVFGIVSLALTAMTSSSYLVVVLLASLLLGLLASGLMPDHESRESLLFTPDSSGSGGATDCVRNGGFNLGLVHKGRLTILILSVVLGVMLTAAQMSIGEPPLLDVDQNKVIYGIDVRVEKNLHQQEEVIGLDFMVGGDKDALAGDKPLMNELDLRKTMNRYQADVRLKQARPGAMLHEDDRYVEKYLLSSR
jgi:UDP-GlcNAc:undecaprenyl-phosphate GlcNAc-1-phosphate transferase